MASITINSQIADTIEGKPLSAPVAAARTDLLRDLAKCCCVSSTTGVSIRFKKESCQPEGYRLGLSPDGEALTVSAGDDLGFVYGIYQISRELLGVTDFWFWNDQPFSAREALPLPAGYCYESSPAKVRYRGWFVNDEILINTWKVNGDSEVPWIMVFEALLRAGGNMVIPGTDRNSRRYRSLAASRGLYITHHHAEPLGAEMFIRTYPDLQPSYAIYPEKFHQLWQEAIDEQKDMQVVWNLGFRGQGDYPFWANDPSYDTDEKRGKLISDLIKLQYDMVKKVSPDAPCCTNLYGEVMELYEKGCLTLPDDVIRIWADNGMGKMVSRRQGNHNPRVPSQPDAGSRGKKGIYYHVSFFDLQAANHLTMLPNSPEFLQRELASVLKNGGSDFWIINCSNIKPHVYFLDLVAELWRRGKSEADAQFVQQHRQNYILRYYGKAAAASLTPLLAEFSRLAPQYGPHEDDHAGEQFCNYVARDIVSQYMKNPGERAKQILWACDAPDLQGQAVWYQNICSKAAQDYHAYHLKCLQAALSLEAAGESHGAELLRDSLLLQAELLSSCYQGAALSAKSVLTALTGDYKTAFYLAGKARAAYRAGNAALRNREHGKWKGFYANECFAALKLSAQLLTGLMAYLRNLGDGPDFYKWQREFYYSPQDRNVVTLLLWENQLTDDEMLDAMEARITDSRKSQLLA